MAQRQEVLNVILAQLLSKRGVIAGAERIVYKDGERHMPDVLVEFQGLRIAIEGEFQSANAQKKALDSAERRVETRIAYIGVAVVYPVALRHIDDFSQLPEELGKAELQIATVSELGSAGFTVGNVDTLEQMLRRTLDQLVKEDVVAEAVALIDMAVDTFMKAVSSYKGVWGKIAFALGRASTEADLETLSDADRAANCRVGGLVVLNAMIFHEILSGLHGNPNIVSLEKIKKTEDFSQLPTTWQYILDNINFYSIFHLAQEIFFSLSMAVPYVPDALNTMLATALKISAKKAALRHDLMGRVYHRLLADAKYLGTYYTSIPAATLLLKLALRPAGWSIQWDDPEQLKKLKIADLACGTGTLLMAAAETVFDNHVVATTAANKTVQSKEVHKAISESILYGYDILASAVHLTASTLALRNPDVPFKKMNLFAMPYGGEGDHLGTLDFLSGNLAQTAIPLGEPIKASEKAQQVTGGGMQTNQYITLPDDLDLCVMNPPFVRSVGGNLLFGSIANENQRNRMQKRLRKLLKTAKDSLVVDAASITSGLGSVFVSLANKYINKRGGRLALVLPKALLSGVSWQQTRNLINQSYQIDYLVVSHDAERWNFSDSTDLSEALLVATKNDMIDKQYQTTIINLWRNPKTAIEALHIARQVEKAQPPDLLTGQGALAIMIDGQKAGEIVSFDWRTLKNGWFLPCAFAQSDLTRTALSLIQGNIKIPTLKGATAVQLCSLGDLGKLGPDRRDIYDGFDPIDSPTSYPAFWGHNADAVFQLEQKINKYLQPLSQAKKRRTLRRAEDLWQLSGQILLAEGMRLNTQKLIAVCVPTPVLSNVWWSFNFHEKSATKNFDKALAIWLNSTLGLLLFIAKRDETEGAWVHFKKPSLTAMSVLDIRTLSEAQLEKLADAYDKIATLPLKPLPQMAEDETRAMIDKAISDVLGLPDISPLRTLLGREPVVSMKRL